MIRDAGLKESRDLLDNFIRTARLETVADKDHPPRGAVVLIDEIDKADPDVPNNLLVPIGSLQFEMHEAGVASFLVKASDKLGETPLVIITTNNERELPNAFLRRCVTLELKGPAPERLVRIGLLHLQRFPELRGKNRFFQANPEGFCRSVAGLPANAARPGTTEVPSTAEFLDALKACIELGVSPDGKGTPEAEAWPLIRQLTLSKDRSGKSA